MRDFEEVWKRIVENASRESRQYRRKPFTYTIKANSVYLSASNQVLGRKEFEKALERQPRKVSDLQDLRGPSYLFAVATDDRIR